MEHPTGLKENLKVASRGGSVAKGARDLYEKETISQKTQRKIEDLHGIPSHPAGCTVYQSKQYF